MKQIIAQAVQNKASDIHLVCGIPIRFRIHGALKNMDSHCLTHEDCERYAKEMAGRQYPELVKNGELDLALSVDQVRVRVNLFKQQGHISAAIRLLSGRIPRLEELGLPPAVLDFPKLRRGIVLVTGETGSGKSTTLAALLNCINQTRNDHILTLEDPIEYLHMPDKCIINQREVGRDTKSFAEGLRAALREDPDVILIGEMRDLATIETAITAAETGHLVFATLHTGSAADSIDRMVDVFPEDRQKQIRMQLSMTLKAVLSQQLIPAPGQNSRVLACELMIVNAAIKNLIREGKTPMIQNAIATTANEGAVSMDNFLINLVRAKKIDPREAVEHAAEIEYVKRSIGGS